MIDRNRKGKTLTLKFKKVAVLGATGPTGRALVRELVQRKIPVRAVSRRFQALNTIFPGNSIEKKTGDALDPASLEASLEGCDLIVDCIGLPADQMEGHPKTAKNMAGVMKQTGARGIQVSSYWSFMPLGPGPLTENHPRKGGPPWARFRRGAEDILQAAGAAILHLPDFFGPNVHTSTLQMALKEAYQGKPMNWIGRADIKREYIFVPDAMRLAADILLQPEAYGKDWLVPGPGPISGNEIAALAGEILGHGVRVRAASPPLLRLISLFKRDLRPLMQIVPDYVKPLCFDGKKLEDLIGKKPRTPYRKAFAATLKSFS